MNVPESCQAPDCDERVALGVGDPVRWVCLLHLAVYIGEVRVRMERMLAIYNVREERARVAAGNGHPDEPEPVR
jgi:hypothetical protein